MKTPLKAVIWLLSIAMIMASCQSGQKESRLRTADSLLNRIDSLEILLNSQPYDSIRSLNQQARELSSFFKSSSGEVNLRPVLIEVEQLASAQKSLSRFLSRSEGFKKDLQVSKEQLTNLRADISANRLNDSLESKFLNEESQIFSSLDQRSRSEISFASGQARFFIDQKARLLFLRDSLERAKNKRR